MDSRERILLKLQQAQRPFPDRIVEPEPTPVTAVQSDDRGQLLARFIREAEGLYCHIERVQNERAAAKAVVAALEGAQRIISWDLALIPSRELADALQKAGVAFAAPNDGQAEVGLTGAHAALAGSGSLVLVSGPGRPRTAALLPRKHVAVITPEQIVPHFEAWIAKQREADSFQGAANVAIVSGPSRTADIAMEQILGMHGPAYLHVIINES